MGERILSQKQEKNGIPRRAVSSAGREILHVLVTRNGQRNFVKNGNKKSTKKTTTKKNREGQDVGTTEETYNDM